MAARDVEGLLAEARRLHAEGAIAAGHTTAQDGLKLDPNHAATLEFLATSVITRKRQFAEGLDLIDRAVAASPEDAGVWYARGWCYEFAAHELRRRPNTGSELDSATLYATAADSFRRCLELEPAGKLRDDAEDLLDHVENELLRDG